MKTSESIKTISTALLKAQKAITFAAKDATNPHFKNKYADLPAVIDAAKPALNDAGISFLQSASPSDPGFLSLTTRLQHESGEWIEDTATMPLPKQDPQGFGSAMTYCRRYCLAAMVGVYQDDDDGNAASNLPVERKSTKAVAVDAWDSLPDDERKFLQGIADQVLAASPDEAVSILHEQKLDADEKVALWSRLDSKTRSAIKAAQSKQLAEQA